MNRVNLFIKNLMKQACRNSYYSTQTGNPVLVEFEDGVKNIILSDEKTRNALSIVMMKSLIDNIRKEEHNPELRCIVIGANGKVFSAGHNLKELSSEKDIETHKEVFSLAFQLMNAIIDSPVPVIAKVNGVAAAAGCQLVAQCDLSICSRQSSFLTPGVNFGIFCSTPGVALSRKLHQSTTLKMLLTGRSISADEAKTAGLITEVCDENELDQIVTSYCDDIKKKSREVLSLGKRFYYEQLNLGIKEAYRTGRDVMVENLQLRDGREGVDSFIQKRKAIWKHGITESI
ncbi:enoyl-CoA hydratase domain-containing protein 3, mitochondrial [Coccinella septempunctata]|uniref:enoyl-CoA hydratase domain-containing protein 3, mitochondrial n=1 Tax=Coccinella septempunctata TaxID=41139 RepID=UPI001D08E661|nr:enoyl-CoA hydratase domain-containing protein 3, mitochondrial [Coccinella septempunctata]